MAVSESAPAKQPRRTALRATTLMESVYQEILGRLQRGQVSPEDRILDYEVAREFECTRMPVRQALLRLVNEGYLVGTTRGFVTPVLTAQDVREIFQVRRLLEPSAAAGTVNVLNDRQLAALAAAYRKCRLGYERDDIPLVAEANVEFRAIWLEAVQNARLKGTILRFADHARLVRRNTMSKRGTTRLVVEGLNLWLQGFRDRDPVAVRSATLTFLDDAEQQYFLDSSDA